MTEAWVASLACVRGGDVLIAVGGALGEGDVDVAAPFHEEKYPDATTKKPGWKAGLAWGAIEVALGVGWITWP